MYQLYERVEKSKEYMHGSKPIESDRNPFQEGPCLLCISAQVDNSLGWKSNFGITKQGMKMARMRVRGEQNAGFYLKDFPVKFLSMQLDKKDEEQSMTSQERIEAFTNRYLFPLISKDGQKIDPVQAMRNMRNVNIMSYCDGTLKVQAIERILMSKMEEIGYTAEECAQIQSQMCMFPISTDRLSGNQKSICISFKDINDGEVSDNVTLEERATAKQSQIGESVFRYSDTETAYLFDGDGEHNLKKYTKSGTAVPVCLSSVISKALENSIENSSSEKFIPVTTELLTVDLQAIMQRAAEGVSTSELMRELDEGLGYGGARRISEFEAQLLDQLDESYDATIRAQRALDSAEKTLDSERQYSRKIDKAIRENCTETNYWRIVTAAGYQLGLGAGINLEQIENFPSDKQLIEGMTRGDKPAEDEHSKKAHRLQQSVEEALQLTDEINELEATQEKTN